MLYTIAYFDSACVFGVVVKILAIAGNTLSILSQRCDHINGFLLTVFYLHVAEDLLDLIYGSNNLTTLMHLYRTHI